MRSYPQKSIKLSPLSVVSSFLFPLMISSSNLAHSTEFEITPMLGYTYSPDLVNAERSGDTSVSNNANFSLALAWQETSTQRKPSQGQGQVLINYVNRDFTDSTGTSHDFDTLYTHFSGVTFIEEPSYITTFGVGVGAAHFNSDYDNATYFSLTTAIGTRHNISNNLSFITEVRAYATLVDEDEQLFCQSGTCFAYFNGSFWLDTNISLGVAYSF